MKLIDDQLMNGLAEEAKKSPRLRKNYNFHQSLDDKCHRPHCLIAAHSPIDMGTR